MSDTLRIFTPVEQIGHSGTDLLGADRGHLADELTGKSGFQVINRLPQDAEASKTRMILQFHRPGKANGRPHIRQAMSIIDRARHLFENRTCPHCGYGVVEPRQLDDGIVDSANQIIPGTATLVGFRCEGCHLEWGIE